MPEQTGYNNEAGWKFAAGPSPSPEAALAALRLNRAAVGKFVEGTATSALGAWNRRSKLAPAAFLIWRSLL